MTTPTLENWNPSRHIDAVEMTQARTEKEAWRMPIYLSSALTATSRVLENKERALVMVLSLWKVLGDPVVELYRPVDSLWPASD